MSSFTTMQKVRFGHVDPAGIAYFPRIYNYIHEAFEELWEEHMGVRYYAMLTDQKVGFPLVHSEVDFRSPLRFGDRPLVRITCFKLGRSSMGLRYIYTLGDRVCVDARMTTAYVDLDNLRAKPIPDAFRAKFEAILEPLEDQ